MLEHITFYFITEIMVIIITLNLLREDYKIWQIAVLALAHSFALYQLHNIPSLLYNISISILLVLLFCKYIFNYYWIQSLLITMISFAIFITLENLLFGLFHIFLGLNYNDIFTSSQHTFFLTIIAVLILLFLHYLIRHFNFSFLTKSITYFCTYSKNKQIIYIMLMIAIENILLIYYFFYHIILHSRYIDNHDTILLAISIIIPVLLFSIILHLFKLINDELEYIANNKTIKNLTQLNFALQTQKHDFKQHLQLLMSLIQLKKYDRAREYMRNITEEFNLENNINTGIPALDGLLQYKLALARKLNIQLEIDLSSRLDRLNIETSQVCRIIGNLLDNALEYLQETDLKQKIIHLHFQQKEAQYQITVTNSLEETEPDLVNNIEKILEPGYTTKQSNHGLGLSIVKDFVTQAGGTILPIINQQDRLISFLIHLPCK